MKNNSFLYAFMLALTCFTNLSEAAGVKMHMASESDFVGFWRIMLIPNELSRSELKNEVSGYSDPCQFFIHLSSGKWVNLTVLTSIKDSEGKEVKLKDCPATKSELEPNLTAVNATSSEYVWHIQKGSDGFFWVKKANSQVGDFLWRAVIIDENISRPDIFGFDLVQGDMTMNLMRRRVDGKIEAFWGMVLRPLK